MTISEQKQLIKRFYLVSLGLNVVLPLVISYMFVGDMTGEIEYLYLAAIIWAIGSIIIYGFYFLIPGFVSKRDKIGTLFFPSMLVFGCCFLYVGFIYLLMYTILLNIAFVWIWNRKFKNY